MFLWSCLLLVPTILAKEEEFPVTDSPTKMQRSEYHPKIDFRWMNILTDIEIIGHPSTYLDLSYKYLKHIEDNAFRNLSHHIKHLNVSHNCLESLGKDTFAGLTNLELLDLSYNVISRIENSFSHLSNLKILDLSYNAGKLVPKDFFNLTESCHILLKPIPIPMDVSVSVENAAYASNSNLEHAFEAKTIVKICIHDAKLISLEHYTNGDQLPSGCRTDKYYAGGTLNMAELDITEFEKGWYKLRDATIRDIYLGGNRITRLTSEMFNDLPENISSVDLSYNKIVRLEKGIIVNQHLREMNFEHNEIIEIEDDTFINTNLTSLKLSHNQLTNTTFAATLPPTLREIHLNDNKITEISGKSFLKLNKLENLLLRKNHITKIHKDSLEGLSALKNLNLMSNRLKIDAGSFKHLKSLEVIILDVNDANEFDVREFDGMPKILSIYLGSITSWNIPRDTLINPPKKLFVIDLQKYNVLFLSSEVFIRPPEYMYLIENNANLFIYTRLMPKKDLVFL